MTLGILENVDIAMLHALYLLAAHIVYPDVLAVDGDVLELLLLHTEPLEQTF